MRFDENLRTLIEERKLTQKEVARQLNMAPSTLGSYVQNVREPDFSTIKQIAQYFDVTIDYLLDFHSDKQTTIPENEILRIFRSLTPKQQHICIEQCKVFIKVNAEEKK